MKRIAIGLLLTNITHPLYAWAWQDLWATPDQQAAHLFEQQQFKQAEQRFTHPAWQATAAYRAGDFTNASTRFSALKSADGYYNQGNALARLGQYEHALEAYKQSLTLRPNDPDTLHNQALVQSLLKQDKQDQDKQNQDKQNQDKHDQDKQDQDKQNQDKQNQDKQNQDKQDQDKHDQDKQDQDKQDQDKQDQDKQDQDKHDQDKHDQDKHDQDKHDQDKHDQKKPEHKPSPDAAAKKPGKAARNPEQEANEQWLRLIPDDPGGLLREKFLRDHQRRMQKDGYDPL